MDWRMCVLSEESSKGGECGRFEDCRIGELSDEDCVTGWCWKDWWW